jgi:ferric-dicitrate binding protein FerR (iron transport regulator)
MAEHEFKVIEDFVFDATFRDWVLHNESGHKAFWEKWMIENRDKLAVMNYAKSIVYALSANHNRLSEQEIDQEIRGILQLMKSDSFKDNLQPAHQSQKIPAPRMKPAVMWLGTIAAAAAVILFVIIYFSNDKNKESRKEAFTTTEKETSPTNQIEKINTSDTAQFVLLPDQSKVELLPGSTLTYTSSTFNSTREIHLAGEAFFDVKKMPSTPFMVYTSNMVTKVLGTSFRVKEFPGDKKASVTVKTGKVSVYKHETISAADATSKQLGGVIVIPNQQVVYDLTTKQLTKNIIEKPLLLEKNSDDIFSFHSTPLKQVFATLERAYGITVMYDETVISSCSLSVNMGNETFYEKLDLICRAINASYESIDGSIFITSRRM